MIGIINWCKNYLELTDLEIETVKYGLELIIGTTIKYIILLFIGYVFHKTTEFILILVIMATFRIFAGGVHRKTSIGCFMYMLCVCMASVYLSMFSTVLAYEEIAIIGYMWILFIVFKYVPLQSLNNPIDDCKVLRAKKVGAIICVLGNILMFTVFCQDRRWICMYPLIIESTTLMVESKKRRENNYEQNG